MHTGMETNRQRTQKTHRDAEHYEYSDIGGVRSEGEEKQVCVCGTVVGEAEEVCVLGGGG